MDTLFIILGLLFVLGGNCIEDKYYECGFIGIGMGFEISALISLIAKFL